MCYTVARNGAAACGQGDFAMGEEPKAVPGQGDSMATLRVAVGLLVFLVGIALIVFVFVQAYNLFDTVDDEIAKVGATADNPDSDDQAMPGSGPTLGQVAVGVGLRIGLLIALGFLAGLVSTQGVRMIAAHRGSGRA